MGEPAGFVFFKEEEVLPLGLRRALHLLHLPKHPAQDGHDLQPHCLQVWELKAERWSPSYGLHSWEAFAPSWVDLNKLSVLPSAASPRHHFQAPLLEDLGIPGPCLPS